MVRSPRWRNALASRAEPRPEQRSGLPARIDKARRTNSKKPTRPLTGLPGRPNTRARRPVGSRRPDPEPEGLARLETHLVENAPDAERVERRRNQVALAGRYAAGDEQNVRFEPAGRGCPPAARARSGAIGEIRARAPASTRQGP